MLTLLCRRAEAHERERCGHSRGECDSPTKFRFHNANLCCEVPAISLTPIQSRAIPARYIKEIVPPRLRTARPVEGIDVSGMHLEFEPETPGERD